MHAASTLVRPCLLYTSMMERYSDRIAPVYRPEDIRKNAEAGKISGMLSIEEAGCCKGSLGVLRRMYELGVRMMTLTLSLIHILILGFDVACTG